MIASNSTLPVCPVCGESSVSVVSAAEIVPDATLPLDAIPPVDATVALPPSANVTAVEPDQTVIYGASQLPKDAPADTVALPNAEAPPSLTLSLSDYQASRAFTLDGSEAPAAKPADDRGIGSTEEGGTVDFRSPVRPANDAFQTHLFQTDGTPIAEPTRKKDKVPLPPPKPIPGYEIIATLGRGAMGAVYMARHVQLDRIVALKMVLAGERALASDRAQFLSEARAVAQLAHPNILQIYEVGERDGQPYFSLEFLEGGTLQEKLEKYSMPPRESAQLIETLARALHYAHQKGILHRDIKPANVLMTTDGAPKFADFGLALRLDRNEAHNPRDRIVGTPMYMSPEQASGSSDIGPATDIYALGATMYEMIVGRPPFRGSTIMDTLKMVKTIEPVPPRQLQPNVPADLQTICLKCLHKDPAQRYKTAEAFANDLRNYLEGRPIDARPASTWEKTWKWSRRNPAAASLIAVSCVGLLTLAIGGAAFAVQENQRAEEQSKLRQVAEVQEKIAKDERKKAEQQRELALKRGKEALDNFNSAQAAVEVLVGVARNRMTNEKHMETVGRELLEKALEFYDGFLAKQPDDPAMRVQVARAQVLAGDLHEKLGHYEQADQTYNRAEKSYRALLNEFPDKSSTYRRDLAGVYINRSTLLQALNKSKDADEAFAKAKELLDKNAGVQGRDPITDWMMGAGCNNRGVYLHQRGQADLAEQAYRQGIDLFGGLAKEFPREFNYHVELARTKTNLAHLWTVPAPGQPEKAAPLYKQAIDELTPIIKLNPNVPSFRKEFGRAFLNRGILYTNQQRYKDADSDFAVAADIFDQLNRTYPGVADYHYLAAAAQINLGSSKQRQEDWTSSTAAYRLADERLSKLVADEPKIVAYQHDLALCTSNLAQVREQHLRASAKSVKNLAADKDWANLAIETERTWYLALDRWKRLNQIDAGELKNAAELAKSYGKINELHKYLAGTLRKVKPMEAETQLERRVAICKEMLAKLPKERSLIEVTGEALLTLGLIQAEMKQHQSAAETVEELAKLVPTDSPWYPLAAGCMAQCLAAADKNLTGEQREKAVKRYGDQAVSMLDAAAAAGWNNLKFLQANPILQPLRQRPEYRSRLEQLQKQIEANK